MKMQQRSSNSGRSVDERAHSSVQRPESAGGANARSGLQYALALLPFLGFLVGAIYFNQVTPLVIGFPRLLAWLVLWILLTSLIMSAIYYLDPENTTVPAGKESNR
jgi:Protein of unknown function (DUF3311)